MLFAKGKAADMQKSFPKEVIISQLCKKMSNFFIL